MVKKVYLIRHAQSEANAAIDLDNPTFYYDARITDFGKNDTLKLREQLTGINFDLLVCSPLARTLQTFNYIFPNPIKNTKVLSLVREHLDHSCDVGRQPYILQKEFPNFNFSELSKYWWNNNIPLSEKAINHESIRDLDQRVLRFKKWINTRKERTIAVVSHGTFISRIIYFFLDNCEFKIWYPDKNE